MKFKATAENNGQVQGTIEAEGESFGYHPPSNATLPFVFSIGMAPGNRDFDELFPNATVERDERTGEIVVLDLGEPAHPIEAWEPPPPPPVVVAALDFYRRLNDEEGAKVEKAIQAQPFLKRQIFLSAQTFRSDAPGDEWELLVGLANGLFGPERAAELLAPSA